MPSYATLLRRSAHLRATPQRIAVLRALMRTREHPDAETLFNTVSRRMPGISLDTVYRTLSALEQAGAARRVPTLSGKARYDADTRPHAHRVCPACERVEDLPPEPVSTPGPEGLRREVVFVGLCDTCRRETAVAGGAGPVEEDQR